MAGARPAKVLLRSDIEEAVNRTTSLSAAARYLDVSYNTFKKYCQLVAPDLWEMHKNQFGHARNRKKDYNYTKKRGGYNMKKLLLGGYNGQRLNKKKLIINLTEKLIDIFPPQCNICGFNERRMTDLSLPFMINFLDNDHTNYKQENMELVCFNCFYL